MQHIKFLVCGFLQVYFSFSCHWLSINKWSIIDNLIPSNTVFYYGITIFRSLSNTNEVFLKPYHDICALRYTYWNVHIALVYLYANFFVLCYIDLCTVLSHPFAEKQEKKIRMRLMLHFFQVILLFFIIARSQGQ